MRKPDVLHMRKQRRRSASQCAKLISAFVFATRIVQFLFSLNPKFQASVAAQDGLYQTWPEIPKTGFLSRVAAHLRMVVI